MCDTTKTKPKQDHARFDFNFVLASGVFREQLAPIRLFESKCMLTKRKKTVIRWRRDMCTPFRISKYASAGFSSFLSDVK